MTRKSQVKRGLKREKQSRVMHHYVRSALGNSHLQKTTVLSLIVAAMVLCWQQLADIEVLPIEVVQIKGEFKFLSREDLKQRAMPYVQGGFFSVDLKTIRRALIDLPWVEDVSVRRQWPNELSVRVIEKQAVAFWGQDGLLSSRANLFRPKKIYRHLNLPKIYGPEGQHEFMLQELAKMQAWLAGTELVITEIKQDARRSWVLSLLLTASEVSMPAMELRLGRDQQHERLHRFVDIYQRHLKKYKQKIRHIDMRYTNGFAVAWQNQEA